MDGSQITIATIQGLFAFASGALLYLQHANRRKLDRELAPLKANLEKGVYVHKVQFEKEFEAYSKIWTKLVSLREKVADMVGTSGHRHHNKILVDEFSNSWDEFRMEVDNNKPFYDLSVFNKLDALILSTRKRAFLNLLPSSESESEWTNIEEGQKKLFEQIDEAGEAIRERLALIVAI